MHNHYIHYHIDYHINYHITKIRNGYLLYIVRYANIKVCVIVSAVDVDM